MSGKSDITLADERGNKKLRLLDEHLGPWILFFLKIFYLPIKKLCNLFCRPTHRIAVVKLAGVGDLILLSGVLMDLRRAFPAPAQITLFVGRENFSYANGLRGFDHLVCVNVTSPLEAVKQMRQNSFDLVFNFDSWSRWSAILSTLMRSRKNVGFRTPGQRRHFCDDVTAEHRGDRHELENDRELLRAVGVPVASPPLPLLANPWTPVDPPFVVFHFWASGLSGELREWAAENWLAVFRALPVHYQVVLTGSNAERARTEVWLKMLSSEEQKRVTVQTGQSWKDVALLLSQARGVIVGDTGIAHLAAVQGAPTLALFGPSQPTRWAPLGERVLCLFKPAADADFLSLGFEVTPHLNSMKTLTVGDVIWGLQKLGVTPQV